MSTARQVAAGIAAIAAITLGVLAGVAFLAPTQREARSATVLEPARPLPPLSLVDQDGRPFTTESLRGRWSLLFAGFTYCPDVCPTTLAMLHKVEEGLPAGQRPQVVFFSVDPGRDTPARLKEYVQYFDPSFIGVTADEPALAEAARAFGIAYASIPGSTEQDYTMDHSAMLVLVDPHAAIRAYFLPPFEPELLRGDLAALTGARG